MVPYILAENPGIDSRRAFELSKEMTRDEKFDIFLLALSFIGWYLLGAITCGIGILFLEPYYQATFADTAAFDAVNYKLMNGMSITDEEEKIFIEESVNSPALYEYIKSNRDEYSLFVYIPYMFGTTYYGVLACPEKSVLIPCFHDEPYVYLNIFKKAFTQAAGMVFNAQPEAELAERVFGFSKSGTKNIKL